MDNFDSSSIDSAVSSAYGLKAKPAAAPTSAAASASPPAASGTSDSVDFDRSAIESAVSKAYSAPEARLGTAASPKSNPQEWNTELKGADLARTAAAGAANMVTGGIAGVVGGYKGIYGVMSALKDGKSLGDALNQGAAEVEKVQNFADKNLTIDKGRPVVQLLNVPIEKAAQGMGMIGGGIQGALTPNSSFMEGATTDDPSIGQTVGNVGFQSLATIAGGQAMLKPRLATSGGAAVPAVEQAMRDQLAARSGATVPLAEVAPAAAAVPMNAPELPAYMRREPVVVGPVTPAAQPMATVAPQAPAAVVQQSTAGVPLADVAPAAPISLAPVEPVVRRVPPAAVVPEAPKVAPAAPVAPAMQISIATPKEGIAAAIESAPDPLRPAASPIDLPADVQTGRQAVLKELGLEKVRKSALTGNVLEGATDAQLTKSNEAAGHQMLSHFNDEYNALTGKGAEIVSDNGGRVGLTDKNLYATGERLATPIDALNEWFNKASAKLYETAAERSNGLPTVKTDLIHAVLNDPSFINGIMADDQLPLLNGIKNQLELFEKNNPGGLTVANAEELRQFINKRWKNNNASTLEPIKESIDNAVTQSAGEDVFATSREMWKLKKDTIDNPKGMARLFEKDPNDPLSRKTKVEDMASTLLDKLSIDQFNGVIDTYRNKMPGELAPHAQEAIKALKAHVANEIIEAGQPNTKTTTPFWNNRRVNDYLDSHGEKIQTLFADDPKGLQKLHVLRAGGNILAVDTAYPGAAAQASNAMKQGVMSRLLAPAATSAGGAMGSLFGPGGAAAGAWAGRIAGEKAAASRGEAAALKRVGKRVVPLSDVAP